MPGQACASAGLAWNSARLVALDWDGLAWASGGLTSAWSGLGLGWPVPALACAWDGLVMGLPGMVMGWAVHGLGGAGNGLCWAGHRLG